jgi:hypothetical protein
MVARLPTLYQFVPDVRTDAEPPTQLPPIRSFLQRKPYKFLSLLHD